MPDMPIPISSEEISRWPSDYDEWRKRWRKLGLGTTNAALVLGHSEGQQRKLEYGQRDLRRYHIIPLLFYEEQPERLERFWDEHAALMGG